MQGRSLRVFYNASALPPRPAGAGIYALELGRALAATPGVELVVAAPPPYQVGSRTIAASARLGPPAVWELTSLRAALAYEDPDVYHGPHMFTPRSTVPSVATVHDLAFFRLPRRYDFAHRHYYRYLARTAKRAGRIIVPSSSVASDAVRFLGYPPEHIRVVYEAPRAGLRPASAAEVEACRAHFDLPERYLLCLGTAEPGKRAVDAIRALPAILEKHLGVVLALAGNPGRLSEPLRREARRLGVESAVNFVGYVEDELLGPLITGATALIFPSLTEGFGLPPLEALACGTPVIATDVPAMNEVLAGSGTAFVPVRSPGAIVREAVRLLADPARAADRSEQGEEFARRFSWNKAAAETVGVYREVAQ